MFYSSLGRGAFGKLSIDLPLFYVVESNYNNNFLYRVDRPNPIRSIFFNRSSLSNTWATVGRATLVRLEISPGAASSTDFKYSQTAICFEEKIFSACSLESSSKAIVDC